MGFKFVVLWTDVALWVLFAALLGYVWRVSRHDTLRATWRRVLRDAPALCSLLVLVGFIAITALDSVHFRRVLAAAVGQPAGTTFYDTRTESLLDLVLARQTYPSKAANSSHSATSVHNTTNLKPMILLFSFVEGQDKRTRG